MLKSVIKWKGWGKIAQCLVIKYYNFSASRSRRTLAPRPIPQQYYVLHNLDPNMNNKCIYENVRVCMYFSMFFLFAYYVWYSNRDERKWSNAPPNMRPRQTSPKSGTYWKHIGKYNLDLSFINQTLHADPIWLMS